MGASEVCKVLEKRSNLTSTEIAEIIDKSTASVKTVLRKLLKDPVEDIRCRPLTDEEKIQRYGTKFNAKIMIYWKAD